MIQFYAPDIESTGELPADESLHAVRVLRLREGDELTVVDGAGRSFRCVLTAADPRHAGVEILNSGILTDPWPFAIEVAVAPTKNSDRLEWFVEKAVEIGVDRIIPLECDRSERRRLNAVRLERVAVAAMKQSLKARLPQIAPLTPLADYANRNDGIPGYFGYCVGIDDRRRFVDEYHGRGPLKIMIGPEGDFSPAEVRTLLDSGWIPVTFGDTRLRTETAALYGLTAAHVLADLHSASQKAGQGSELKCKTDGYI